MIGFFVYIALSVGCLLVFKHMATLLSETVFAVAAVVFGALAAMYGAEWDGKYGQSDPPQH